MASHFRSPDQLALYLLRQVSVMSLDSKAGVATGLDAPLQYIEAVLVPRLQDVASWNQSGRSLMKLSSSTSSSLSTLPLLSSLFLAHALTVIPFFFNISRIWLAILGRL
jgi:hypothetical protein